MGLKRNKKVSGSVRVKQEDGAEKTTSISLGVIERKILKYLANEGAWYSNRFNIREYERKTGIPKTTVGDTKNRLFNKGLINDRCRATELGLKALESFEKPKPTKRLGAQRGQLSTHYVRFKFDIVDRSNFQPRLLDRLNPTSWRSNELPNYTQYYAYLDGATIIIDKNTVSIRIHDLLTNDTDEAMYQNFNRAIVLVDEIRKVGIKGGKLSMPQGHFARVESFLADFLEKVDERYFIELGDGSKFWIDNSTGEIEDETDSLLARERLDRSMTALMENDIDLLAINEIKNITADLVLACNLQMRSHEEAMKSIIGLTKQMSNLIKVNEGTAGGIQAITSFLQLTEMKKLGLDKKQEKYDGGKPDYFN